MHKSLFFRFFLITVLPIIILQCIVAYIFYERHWDSIAKRLEKNLIGEIKTIATLYNSLDEDSLQKIASNLGFKILHSKNGFKSVIDDQYLNNIVLIASQDIGIPLQYATLGTKPEILVYNEEQQLFISFSYKKFNSPTIGIFFAWMAGSSILLLAIALLFMRNQVNAILELADVAEKLGQGQDCKKYIPRGAKEVRKVGKAFLQMKNRIERQIYFRTQMLAHISHDLRTPLTRLRLQIEFPQDGITTAEMKQDIDSMQHIIDQYMEFAKGEGNEKNTTFDIIGLIKSTIAKTNYSNITLHTSEEKFHVTLGKISIQRALTNILENALKHCHSKINLTFISHQKFWILKIEDDGEGVDPKYYRSIFKPFFKLDDNSKGFGLGLSIVKTIVYNYGGKIKLAKSDMGGLSVIIKVPT